MFEEQRLCIGVHDVFRFDCGVAALNRYLIRFAGRHQTDGISQTYVLVEPPSLAVVLGYYTLSPAQIDDGEGHRAAIPCVKITRLACRRDRVGTGLGRLLIGCAVERCRRAGPQVACNVLIAEAEHENAQGFYAHYGFIACVDQRSTLYLPLG